PPPPPPSAAPLITSQSFYAAVLQEGTATFTVAAQNATGYEWQQSPDGATWTDVSGGNTATLNVVEPLSANGLQYRVIVSGPGGQVTSVPAPLSVYPVMALQPMSRAAFDGDDVSFTGGATFDLAHISQQWQESRDGQTWTDIAGATSQMLTLHAFALTDSGLQVRAVVSAFGHTYTSNVATLSVTTNPSDPVFVAQPEDATVAAGGDVRFSSWTSGGGAMPAYQWQSSTDRGGQWNAIPGANLQVLTLSGVAAASDGELLRLQVTSNGRAFLSQAATLHVGAAGAGRLDLLAGALGGIGDLDGTGSGAWLQGPGMPGFDAQGNLFVLDNQRFKRIDPSGRVTTIAGRNDSGGQSDGAGGTAMFYGFFGSGTAVAANGDAYVAEAGNCKIRKVTADGTVTTFAGTYACGSADGTGSAASFNQPRGLAIDAAGNLYVADTGNDTIRRITPAGVVTTLAGTAGVAGSTDGASGVALLNAPWGITVDPQGQVVSFIDGGHTVRQWTAAGGVKTLAGSAGTSGAADGTGAAASFKYPTGLATDSNGTLYVADSGNDTIRKVTPAGVVTTIAGLAGAQGAIDATGAAARFSKLTGVALAPDGSLAVVDGTSVRRIGTAGNVTTLAGSIEPQGQADGVGPGARFDLPRSVIADANGNLIVGDGHGLQRRVARDGTTSTFNTGGYADGMAFDHSGNLIVADGSFDCVVRRVSPQGSFIQVAGNSSNCQAVDGNGTQAGFSLPRGVAVGLDGEIYVMDRGRLRRIATNGDVTTLTSTDPNVRCGSDGALSSVIFCGDGSMVIDEAGNLFIADAQAVRRVDAVTQQVSTIAGSNSGVWGSVDGNGSDARFGWLQSITRDPTGNLYVSDFIFHNVRRIDPAGNVTTLVGRAGVPGIVLGTAAALDYPEGLAMMDATHLAILSMDAVLVYTLPGGTPLAATASHRGRATQAARPAGKSRGH
ncbi:MAG TPA: NHL repeat-containing protein, partial [Burkholderiaceae bacterium]